MKKGSKKVSSKKVKQLIKSFECFNIKHSHELKYYANNSIIGLAEHMICIDMCIEDYEHLYNFLLPIYNMLHRDFGLTDFDDTLF